MTKFKIETKLEKEGLKIAKLLKSGGFKAFWVGGSVRDKILKREITNLDIATSATPEQTIRILKKSGYPTKEVGKEYGTILAITKSGIVEVTTFRKEGEYVNRRKPKDVAYIEDYYEDSKRRDFTINALYYDPVAHILLDPQNGQKDIKRKLIKFVGDHKKRIDEDALRMLRAARFSTQLGFKIEKNSFAAIKTRAKYIQQISGERVKAELDKILSHADKEDGVRLLDQLGLLRFIMPEVNELKKIWHKSKMYHLEGNVFEHTMMALRNIKEGDPTLAYAALYHDAGKAKTATPRRKPEGMVNSFPAHEFVSAVLFKSFSKKLKFSRRESDLILWITKMHMTRIPFTKDMKETKKMVLAKHKYFPCLIELWKVDALSNLKNVDGKIVQSEPTAYQEGKKLLNAIKNKENVLKKLADGEFIMNCIKIKSGPKIGQIKNNLENKIIAGDIKNISDAKKFLEKYANVT